MSRLDCGPSLHNYTAAPSGAHLVFHQRAIAILLPSATGTGKSAREAHALVNTEKNVKVLHKSLARGLTTRKMTATIINLALRTESLPKSFWICLTRPSGKETASVFCIRAGSRDLFRLVWPARGLLTVLVLASAAALC